VPRVFFCPDLLGAKAREVIHKLMPGEIVVLENLRRNRGEVVNDLTFARELASLADVFVQDSFDTCHRVHASIVSVPKYLPSYAGFTVLEEAAELTKALTPKSPSFAVIGGAKFSTKEPVLERLLEIYDRVFVGGALANDFLKASGQAVGKSLVSLADESHIKRLLKNPKLVIPVDSRVVPLAKRDAQEAHEHARVVTRDVEPDDVILDHGPATEALLRAHVQTARTFLWNGPLGRYENGFTDTTTALAHAVASSSAHSVLGGGDTVAAVEALGLLNQFSFVSTGGGAMLDFLAEGTLPGITALG
jgi:3-phosphoglycerate kinase